MEYNILSRPSQPVPQLLPVRERSIPTQLKTRPARWAPWAAVWNDGRGKVDKVPLSLALHRVSTHGPWWDFERALAAHEAARDRTAGIGYRMTEPHGIVGIDLDHCVDPNGEVAPWASVIVQAANSYVERSPSGTGLRIFGFGEIVQDWNNHERGVEVYGGHGARFLTVTGQRLEGAPHDVQPFPSGFMTWLEGEYRKQRDAAPATSSIMPELVGEDSLPSLDDLDLPLKARAFLEEGEGRGDRSLALAGATAALYQAVANTDGLRDGVVLSLLRHNPFAWDVALDHRQQDEDRALEYLWRHHCEKLRNKVTSVEDDFEAIEAIDTGLAGPEGSTFTLDELTGTPYAPPTIVTSYLLQDAGGFVAPGGLGKTTLGLYECVHIILGKPRYGRTVERPGGIIFITAEDGRRIIGSRLNQILRGMDLTSAEIGEVARRFHCEDISGRIARLVEMTKAGVLRQTKLIDEIVERYHGAGISLVHIDPTSLVGPGEASSNDGMAELLRASRRLSAELQAAVRLVHHTSKEVARSGTTDQYAGRGGAAFADNSRFQHQLVMVTSRKLSFEGTDFVAPAEISDRHFADGKVLAVLVHKLSYGKRVRRPIWLVREGFSYRWFDCGPADHDAVKKSTSHANMMGACELVRRYAGDLDAHGRPVRFSRTQLEERFREAGLGRNEMRVAVQDALLKGYLIESDLPEEERVGRRKTYLAIGEVSAALTAEGLPNGF